MAQRTVALYNGKYIGIESIYTVVDGKQINIPEKLNELRAKSQNNELFCPCGCGSNLILVAGERNLREQHFRLKDDSYSEDCKMPTEGKLSVDSKIVLKCWLDDKLHSTDIESRVPIHLISDTERKYEFTFLSRNKGIALSYCNQHRNLSEEKFKILEDNSKNINIIYIVDSGNSLTHGQYPESMMRVQSRQGYCLFLTIENADYLKAEMEVSFYAQNIDGLWTKVIVVCDKISNFGFNDKGLLLCNGILLDKLVQNKKLEYEKQLANKRQFLKKQREDAEKARLAKEQERLQYEAEVKRKEQIRLEQEKECREKEAIEKKKAVEQFMDRLRCGNFDENEKIIDQNGNRWIQCKFCGKFAKADAFVSYGGAGNLNKGKCNACSRNPNIKTDIDTVSQKEKTIRRYDPNICPECGGKLKEKRGYYGYFMGCENYPLCKFTRRVKK